MRPARNCADQKKNQNDKQDSAEHGRPHGLTRAFRARDRQENVEREQKFPNAVTARAGGRSTRHRRLPDAPPSRRVTIGEI
jgi:hypothetical protein